MQPTTNKLHLGREVDNDTYRGVLVRAFKELSTLPPLSFYPSECRRSDGEENPAAAIEITLWSLSATLPYLSCHSILGKAEEATRKKTQPPRLKSLSPSGLCRRIMQIFLFPQ
ncbi:hypothetical protein C2S53_019583 [Perilla frutescens var. hirtella]|uniref:Uncharacterized protein n=1 Tax=Perilla frutescens var. hirtella TaxID=608512 RepID=A0AAD4IY64_PERFH|nr:hypothetical protein C2S53_019583 [Perilla frutescens var. hirtella]